MSGIGEILRDGREKAGLSREEMARTIRVPVSTVTAMEEERWGALPPPVYVRGFVSSWCRVAGIDQGAARDALLRSLGEVDADTQPLPGVPAGTGITVGVRLSRRSRGAGRIYRILMVLALLAAGVFVVTAVVRDRRAGVAAGPVVPPAVVDTGSGQGACAPDPGVSAAPLEAFGD